MWEIPITFWRNDQTHQKYNQETRGVAAIDRGNSGNFLVKMIK